MEHNNIHKSVFKVTHSGGSGSCFYLKSYDLFVTNYHVVEGFRTVAIHDNARNPYLASASSGSAEKSPSAASRAMSSAGLTSTTLAR